MRVIKLSNTADNEEANLANQSVNNPAKLNDSRSEEIEVYKKSYMLQAIAELGRAPSNHPTVEVLQGWMDKLRQAAHNDPVLKYLKIDLPQECELTLLFDSRANAFVFPGVKDQVFVNAGLVERCKDLKELVSVLAHEQGHQIKEALIEKLKELQPRESLTRFGETIWRPNDTKASDAKALAMKEILSQREEGWADTYGSYPYLDRLGIDPRFVTRAESTLYQGGGAFKSNLKTSGDILDGLLRSHPTSTGERIWLQNTIVQQISYPSSLRQSVSRSEEHSLTTPVDTLVKTFYDRLNSSFGAFSSVILKVASAKHYFFPLAFINLNQAKLASLIDFIDTIALNENSSGFVFHIFRSPDDSTFKNALPFDILETQSTSYPTVKPIVSSLVNLPNELAKYGQKLSERHQHGNTTFTAINPPEEIFSDLLKNKQEEFLTNELKSAGSDTNLGIALTLIATKLQLTELLGNRWAQFLLDDLESGSESILEYDHEKMEAFLDPEQNRSSKSRNENITALVSNCEVTNIQVLNKFAQYLLAGTLKNFVLEAIDIGKKVFENLRSQVILAAQQDLESSSLKFFDQLIATEAVLADLATPLGPVLSRSDLAKLMVEYIYQRFTSDCSELEVCLNEMAAKNLRPSNVWPSAILKLDEHEHSKPKANEEREKLQLTGIPQRIQSAFPELLPCEDKHTLNPYKNNFLRLSSNQHQRLALVSNVIDKKGKLTEEFKSTHPSISCLLKKLETLPCKFEVHTWQNICDSYIHSLSDFHLFKAFLDREYDASRKLNSWAERIYVVALSYALNCAVQRDAGINALEFAALKESFLEVPRSPFRNEAVLSLVKRLLPNASDSSIFLNTLTLLENQPVSVMLKSYVEELHQNGSELLSEVEDEIRLLFEGSEYSPRGLFVDADFESNEKLSKKERRAIEAYLQYQEGFRKLRPDEVVAAQIHDAGSRIFSENTDSYLKKILNDLPRFATPQMIRYIFLTRFESELPEPTRAIPVNPASLAASELAGELVRVRLGIPDLSKHLAYPTSQLSDAHDISRILKDMITLLQPVASPLRDTWLRTLLECVDERGIIPSLQQLKTLQLLAYQPATQEIIGYKRWEKLREHLTNHPESSFLREHAARYIMHVMPYFSLLRNQALLELSILPGGLGRRMATILTSMTYTPGLPNPLPSESGEVLDLSIVLQSQLLSFFDDAEQVLAVMYLNGLLPEKPFAVSYMERLFGGTFESLAEAQAKASSSSRLEFLHNLFGGPQGLFAKGNSSAMSCLAAAISKSIIENLPQQSPHRELIRPLVDELVFRAQLPVFVRVSLLSALIDWKNEKEDGVITEHDIASLISKCFYSLKAPGIRMLQGLVIEPKAFSPTISRILRSSQYNAPPSALLAPFHLSEADGVGEINLGKTRGRGSMAEVHQVLSIDGVKITETVLKSLRSDVAAVTHSLETPLKKVALVLEKHGVSWGEPLIERVVSSCLTEFNNFSLEAKRTGEWVAELFSELIGSSSERIGNLYYLKVADSDVPQIAIPAKVDSPNGTSWTHRYSFMMGDLGSQFCPLSQLASTLTREQIAEYLEQKHIIPAKLADLVGGLFVQALLERNVLLKDLHFGNVGLLENAQVPTIGIVDFGGINEKFPQTDKNWILSLIGSLATQNQAQFKTILLASVALNGGSEFDMLNQIPILNAIETRILKGFNNSDQSASPFETLQEVLGEIYESWPLSEPVKDFIESLRKVVKEWGPWISEQMLANLGANLVLQSFPAHAELSKLTAYKKAHELLSPLGHEQLTINSDSDQAQEIFDEFDKIQKSSAIVMKNPASDSWTILYLNKEYRSGETQVFLSGSIDSRTANTKSCKEVALIEGYLEYRDYDDAIQRIHLKRAFG